MTEEVWACPNCNTEVAVKHNLNESYHGMWHHCGRGKTAKTVNFKRISVSGANKKKSQDQD